MCGDVAVYNFPLLQGAVDFIFGRGGLAYFGGNTIAVKAPGCITASGRESNDTGSCKLHRSRVRI